MTEYQIWTLVGSVGAVVVALLSLAHSVYVNVLRRKDEKKLRALESQVARYQSELMAAEIDPEFQLMGLGVSNQGYANLAVRLQGKEITDVEVESLDEHTARIGKTSFSGEDDIIAVIFEGADREYVSKASFTLRFTNAIGMQRQLQCRIDRGRLITVPVNSGE